MSESSKTSYSIAVDFGTTHVDMALIDIEKGTVLGYSHKKNAQCGFGKDIMSRIFFGRTEKGLKTLREKAIESLVNGIKDFQEQKLIKEDADIKNMFISANATMLAIIEGREIENLGAYPFAITNAEVENLYIEELGFEVIFFPNLSAFVGGDPLSGAVDRDFDINEEYNLLIDLGTNGEMILGNKDGGYGTSCACGPAFESYITRPEGGSAALIKGIGNLKVQGYIDDEGFVSEDFPDEGIDFKGCNIDLEVINIFTLAKAAISAGIEILKDKADISFEDIKNVFIAGAFGVNVDIESSLMLGLFPDEVKEKIVLAGNTSLQGAVKAALQEDFLDRVSTYKQKLISINLAEEIEFNDIYINHMRLKNMF